MKGMCAGSGLIERWKSKARKENQERREPSSSGGFGLLFFLSLSFSWCLCAYACLGGEGALLHIFSFILLISGPAPPSPFPLLAFSLYSRRAASHGPHLTSLLSRPSAPQRLLLHPLPAHLEAAEDELGLV